MSLVVCGALGTGLCVVSYLVGFLHGVADRKCAGK
jgi:hypothetical protein